MEYTYIPTGIKWELLRLGVDSDRKGYVLRTVGGGVLSIRYSRQTMFSLIHIEGITLDAERGCWRSKWHGCG